MINKIQSLFNDVIYGCFNPCESNMFLSVSDNGFINIYDISNSLPISLINLEELFDFNSEIKWSKEYKEYIGFIKDDLVIFLNMLITKVKILKSIFQKGLLIFIF